MQAVLGLGMVGLIHTVGAQASWISVLVTERLAGCIHQFVMKGVKTSLIE